MSADAPAAWEGPDPSSVLANERTLLAYTRTALALVIAGLAIIGSHAVADVPEWLAVVGFPVILLGGVTAVVGRHRYFSVDRAIRTGAAIPQPLLATFLPWGLAVLAFAALVVGAVALATNS